MTQQKAGVAAASADTAKERLRDMADATGEKLKETAADAQEMAGNVADQAREYGAQAQDAANQAAAFLQKSLKEKPMQTLAGVAALAFVIGAILKR